MVREGVFLLLLFGWLGLLLTPVAASEEPVYLLILGEPETFAETFAPAPPLNQRQVGFATMLYTLQASPGATPPAGERGPRQGGADWLSGDVPLR